MELEIITLNETDTLQVERLGATRVELVSAIQEGGLTPSYGTIKTVLNKANIPVQIMIRPHSYRFVYNETDWQIMKEDLLAIKSLGGNRIVFGALSLDGYIDERLLYKVIECVPDFDITFHRAFDDALSQVEAYHILNKYKHHVKRILTSGGKPKAIDGIDNLRQLIQLSKQLNGPKILVGSGVKPSNLKILHNELQATEYHIGSGVRLHQDFSKALDASKMKQVTSYLF